jgi:TatD DNase family protein
MARPISTSRAPVVAATTIDIGANLQRYSRGHVTPESLVDGRLGSILRRAHEAGVAGVLITGTSLKSSVDARELALASAKSTSREIPRLYSTAGVHPHDAKTWNADVRSGIEKLLKAGAKSGVVAAGECGLDFDRNFSTPEAQELCFREQLELVRELDNPPLFLHERSAHERFAAMLQEHSKAGGIMEKCCVHCFTGSAAELATYVEMGCMIGITGFVCNPNRATALMQALRQGILPLDQLLIETDAPFMLPTNVPKDVIDSVLPPNQRSDAAPRGGRGGGRGGRGGRRPRKPRADNEPGFLPYVVEHLAELFGESPERVAETTTRNAIKFFGLPEELSGADASSKTEDGKSEEGSAASGTDGRAVAEEIEDEKWEAATRVLAKAKEGLDVNIQFHFDDEGDMEEDIHRVVSKLVEPGDVVYVLEDQHDCYAIRNYSAEQLEEGAFFENGEGRQVFDSKGRWAVCTIGYNKRFELEYYGRELDEVFRQDPPKDFLTWDCVLQHYPEGDLTGKWETKPLMKSASKK